MAEDDGVTADADTENEDGGTPAKGGKKKLIIIIAAVLLLLIGGGAGAYFMGVFDSEVVVEGENKEPVAPKVVYKYYEMAEMLINLKADAGQVRYLKLLVSVEYEEGIDATVIIAAKPQIEDLFQTYLRELSPKDLEGSMGLFRLREELRKRINVIIAPEKINEILFKKFVVQ